MRHLPAHNQERGSVDPHEQLLRYRNGRPITSRRYDHLWLRLARHFTWVASQQASTHWLRHTTRTWVERNFGYAVARADAGHSGKRDAGTTSTYVRADVDKVASALQVLTGEPHPLALSPLPAIAQAATSRTTPPGTYRSAGHSGSGGRYG